MSLADYMAERADSIINALTGLGGVNDRGMAARPNMEYVPLTRAERHALYRRNAYARRIVDRLPADAVRPGWTLGLDDDRAGELDAEEARLDLAAKIREAWQLARLDGAALVMIVTDDRVPDGFQGREEEWLEQPLDVARVRRVRSIVVLEESEFEVHRYEGRLANPEFGRPVVWQVTPSASTLAVTAGDRIVRRVHASRCIYIPSGHALPRIDRHQRSGKDAPVLDVAWDAIRNKTSTEQAAASLAHDVQLHVVRLAALASVAAGDESAAFKTRMKLLAMSRSFLGALLLGPGEEYEVKANPVTGFKDLDETAARALCAAAEMPAVLLFGDSPAGFNTDGESWKAQWRDTCDAAREDVLRKPLTQLYRLLFATLGIEGEPSITFAPLGSPSPSEEALRRKTIAETDALYVQAGVLDPDHILSGRFGEAGWQDELPPADLSDLGDPGGPAGDMLGSEGGGGVIPEAPVGLGDVPSKEIVLNGAQIASALEIVGQVARGELPRANGTEMLSTFFGLPPDVSERLMGDVGRGFSVAPSDA